MKWLLCVIHFCIIVRIQSLLAAHLKEKDFQFLEESAVKAVNPANKAKVIENSKLNSVSLL